MQITLDLTPTELQEMEFVMAKSDISDEVYAKWYLATQFAGI